VPRKYLPLAAEFLTTSKMQEIKKFFDGFFGRIRTKFWKNNKGIFDPHH